ncbi:MAG: response regulator, partial [Spirochaetaceae bacterium]|nr:response regulator [Spirochaetaceae bacterium]
RDTGVGLTQEQQNRLFQAFSQADTSTTRKYGGTGLGLSISKRLVEMMGGEIGVISEAGKGSTFYFTGTYPLSEKKKKERHILPSILRSLNVLVVDDNESARDVLSHYLLDFSFQVSAVESGERALEELYKADSNYDLVLLDWKMPGMNGIETARMIRQHNTVVPIKIVMVTAYSSDEIIDEVNSLKIDGVLLKPVGQSVLFDTIVEVFGGQETALSGAPQDGDEYPEGFDDIRGARILLVEDNEINQQVAKELLEYEGFRVDIAENGELGAKMALTGEYSIVLMDLQMPVLDGYEATQRIRETIEPEGLRIVAMTADAMTGIRDKVLESGMDDYVTKPIEPLELFSTLVKWIDPEGVEKRDEVDKKTAISVEDEEDGAMLALENIPGLNLDQGLKRVGGNRKVYKKIILSFAEKNRNFSQELQALLDSDELLEAERLAHTLKGVAGNIGADSVFSTVTELDAELKKDKYSAELVHRLLRKTVEELNRLFSSLETFISIQLQDSKRNISVNSLDKKELESGLSDLLLALEDYDAKAKDLIEKLYPAFKSAELNKEFDIIQTKINDYDFDEAVDVLSEIKEKLSL